MWARHVERYLEDGNMERCSVLIFIPPFCAMRHINDPQYNDCEKDKTMKWKAKSQKKAIV